MGGFIGDAQDIQAWSEKKALEWCDAIKKLSCAAQVVPHETFTVFTESLQKEWCYIQRVVEGTETAFDSIRNEIQKSFLPALTALDLDDVEVNLMLKPSRLAGLGVDDPIYNAKWAYTASKEASLVLSKVICNGQTFDIHAHDEHYKKSSARSKESKDEELRTSVESLLHCLSSERKATVERKLTYKCSTWLAVTPNSQNNFILSANEFRDNVALRYARSPPRLHATCDGCGQNFTINHALKCKAGGLIISRHNEFRNCNADLLGKSGLTQIKTEPVIKEASKSSPALILDFCARGFWETQRDAFFDVRIIDADASSYKGIPVSTILHNHAQEKKSKYNSAVEELRGSFTPIITTCDGIFDYHGECYLKRMSERLSLKWDRPYSVIMGWLRCRMQMCILRSVSLCIRGSRKRWNNQEAEDGAAIPLVYEC